MPPAEVNAPLPGRLQVRQYQGLGRKQSVSVLLSDLEMQRLTAAVQRVGVDLALYLRATLNVAAETVNDHRATYTHDQLMSIHRREQNQGHVWTEAEFRERDLPPDDGVHWYLLALP
ncbi:hypothetical protein HNQ09_001694 [Deinococcus budaensis]|uniref:Uncharacterized protein n=1 Tax=Deinococcus budaensis TaxID=1665626 RepID=A0A7W8GFF6_9DEIO|nr:hypothetical protein [Deinococcus budaensis]MBB5234256.1 hypothetical protein [Deinococcus budaensis]